MKVVMMKLITGQELIARKKDDGLYEKICFFHVAEDETGKTQARMFPFLDMVPDATVPLNPNAILTEYDAPDHISAGYIKATTGIEIVGAR